MTWRILSGGAIAALAGAAMLAAASGPSPAFTLDSPSLEPQIAADSIEPVYWRHWGWHGGWHRGWGWRRGWGWHRGWHRWAGAGIARSTAFMADPCAIAGSAAGVTVTASGDGRL
jgi:hypothetical protein